MAKALIRKGDRTTHGGTVLNGFSDYTIQGIPVAGVGHLVACPLCKGVFPIVQGYGGITVNGIFVALEGGLTACGAKLIPSQHEEVVDDGGGASEGYATLSDKPATQKSMINDGVYRPDQDKSELIRTGGAEEDEFRSENDPIEEQRQRNDPFSDLNKGLRKQFKRIDDANKKLHRIPYREVHNPYTMADVGRLSDYADYLEDEVRLQKERDERIKKLEEEAKNKPPLIFENFDKPQYEANQAHNPRSSLYNPKKDPEPSDAEDAYKYARPGKPGQWYSIGRGGIYRYSSTNNGKNHFSGCFSLDQVRKNDKLGAKQLDVLAKVLGVKL